MLSSNQWYAGPNPSDGANPWKFKEDGTFVTLKDDHGGTWNIDNSGVENILKLKWDTVNGYADF